MDSTLICVNWQKYNRQMILYLLIVLLASTSITIHVGLMAQGRAISNLQIQASQMGMKEEGSVKMEKTQNRIIGSRPPKCERRCTSCEKCEAVQIPVAPKKVQSHGSGSSAARGSSIAAYSRGDDITNYKPMSWKCKCGNSFFDP